MILSWLRSKFDNVVMASNDTEARVNCPFCINRVCEEDTGHHLYVNMYEPKAHCFRCEWRGNWISLIIESSETTYTEALYLLEQTRPKISGWQKTSVIVNRLPDKPKGFRTLAGGPRKDWDLEMTACWNYLMTRVKPEIVDYRFGSMPDTNRVWFLVDDSYWTGRAIFNTEPRYMNPSAKKLDTLWNWQALKPGANITLTEGIFGALAVGANGVALLGKSITKRQAQRIVVSDVASVTIMLDMGCIQESYDVWIALKRAGVKCPKYFYWLDVPQPTDGLTGTVEECRWNSVIPKWSWT